MSNRTSFLFVLLTVLAAGACDAWPFGPGGSDQQDLTIRYIERLPHMDFVVGSDDPTHEGWPEPGETVTWRAHIWNWSGYAREVPYSWELDGEPAGDGVVEIGPGEEGTADLEWEWTFDRHTVSFTVDPENEIIEEEEGNNTRSLFTDALAVGFWVEQPVYDAFREIQPQMPGVASTSFEDWAHRHIDLYNQMAAAAVYPETPDGVLDRWRVDRIVVLPRGGLQSIPNPARDQSVDLRWSYPAEDADFYWHWFDAGLQGLGVNIYNRTFIHELGHQRYLLDVYQTRVYSGRPAHRIEVTENGESIVGTYLPIIATGQKTINGQTYTEYLIREPPMDGLMIQDYTFIDRYSAGALNRIAGQRAVGGFPSNLGEYVNDLPAAMGIRVLDAESGAVLDGADVVEYQSELAQEEGQYGRVIDDTPDIQTTADPDGIAWLGSAPFDQDRLDVFAMYTGTVLIRVEHQGRVGYAFLDAMYYNMAYWRGETESAVLDLEVTLH